MDGRALVFLALLTMTGCGQRGTTIVTTKQTSSESSKMDGAAQVAALRVASDYVEKLKSGSATADMLTVDFKKVIGEPLTPAEREKGYSDAAATEWLKIVGPRLSPGAILIVADGRYDLFTGTLCLANVDSKWLIDWVHTGRPKGASAISQDNAPKRFAVAQFLDPLFTNNWELSEAALSDAAKKSLAPALGNDARGYNRGTLRSKLKAILNGATGYAVTLSGDTATVTLTGAVERKLTLPLTAGSRPDVWLVNGFE